MQLHDWRQIYQILVHIKSSWYSKYKLLLFIPQAVFLVLRINIVTSNIWIIIMQKNFNSGLQVKAVQAWELIRWCLLIERCLQLWYNCPTYGIFTFSFINPRLGACRGSLGPSCDPLTFSCAVWWLISAAVNMCGIGIGICYTTVFLENRNCHASSECISRAHSLASF